ncbi:LLM class flavin-dependent oxidoreductase [Paenibacillaceae bacterium]|nr:LLM class flavin-dependent oxidoreductase [Paenibacillaceae bacterium]
MKRKRQLCIGLSLTATWMKGMSWRQGSEGGQPPYTVAFYAELARMAEKAKLDFVFKPDSLVLHIDAQGRSPGFGSLDPTIMLASIARETERIGLVTTMSTTFNPPYVAARQLQSLHWASNGRAGWNIVTSLDGADNFAASPMPPAEERYRKANEFTDVVRKLWGSYPYEALEESQVADQEADKALLVPINHAGEFFTVKGPLNVPAHPSGQIPLFQAGASDAGRNFAAMTADAIFAASPDMAAGIELRQDLQRRAAAYGRQPDAIRVLPGMYFFLARTREEAQEMYREAHAHFSAARRYASIQAILGIDLSSLPLDQRVTAELLPDAQQPVRSRTHADLLRRFVLTRQPAVEELLSRPEVVGSAHWVVVGTPEDALRDVASWFEAGAMDGLIALPGGSIQSLHLFCSELVPMLVERGLFRSEYTGNTLREHMGIE